MHTKIEISRPPNWALSNYFTHSILIHHTTALERVYTNSLNYKSICMQKTAPFNIQTKSPCSSCLPHTIHRCYMLGFGNWQTPQDSHVLGPFESKKATVGVRAPLEACHPLVAKPCGWFDHQEILRSFSSWEAPIQNRPASSFQEWQKNPQAAYRVCAE